LLIKRFKLGGRSRDSVHKIFKLQSIRKRLTLCNFRFLCKRCSSNLHISSRINCLVRLIGPLHHFRGTQTGSNAHASHRSRLIPALTILILNLMLDLLRPQILGMRASYFTLKCWFDALRLDTGSKIFNQVYRWVLMLHNVDWFRGCDLGFCFFLSLLLERQVLTDSYSTCKFLKYNLFLLLNIFYWLF